MYATLTVPQVAYLLKDSGAKLVFVSTPELMNKALDAAAECAHAVQVVVFEPKGEVPEGVSTWADFLQTVRNSQHHGRPSNSKHELGRPNRTIWRQSSIRQVRLETRRA